MQNVSGGAESPVKALPVSLLLLLMTFVPVGAQTTQGMIVGRVADERTGQAIGRALVRWRSEQTADADQVFCDTDGRYSLLRLSPGTYWIRAEAAGYVAREVYELELFVASRVDLNIRLQRSTQNTDAGQYASDWLPSTDSIVHTYTADFRTTEAQPMDPLLGRSGTLLSTLSYVIDPRQVTDLPLSGRDIYAMVLALPGVTADNATARGLGLSVNGQRSSSSNFLLDGVENNDPLLSGPSTSIAPEAVQEYRVSTNNFSAEYGRTGGFVANAITQSGANGFHGVLYGYLNQTALNANSYLHKAGINTSDGSVESGELPRQPLTQLYSGFQAGGPLLRSRWFWSAAYEPFGSESEADPYSILVPVLAEFESCYPASKGTALLKQFQPPGQTGAPSVACADLSSSDLTTGYDATQPLVFHDHLALARLDRTDKDGRWMARFAIARSDQPDFLYSVYPEFTSALDVNSAGITLGRLWNWTAGTNEIRAGYREVFQGWNRPNNSFPGLIAPSETGQSVSLPGSDALYGFHYGDNIPELNDTMTLVRGAHSLSFGGGVLINRANSELTYLQTGIYTFDDIQAFAQDQPAEFTAAVDRAVYPQTLVTPNYARTYSNNQFFAFFEDEYRITARFGVNLGLRYESFGTIKNTGVQDGYIQPGPGQTIEQRLAGAALIFPQSGERSDYRPDRNNWAPRFGLHYDLTGHGRTVFRAAYGIFFDRPFDALTLATRDNSIQQIEILRIPGYLPSPLSPPAGAVVTADPTPAPFWLDNLRTPYVQSWFGGVQQQFSPDFYAEVSAQGALARKLISTDVVNRRAPLALENEGRLNDSLPGDLFFRSNAASSSYSALTALARYRSGDLEFQAAYTWGHSIDNQSDALQGTFEDLQPSRSSNVNRGDNRAAFTQQFDSSADRASSDFDQRQNLVFQAIWQIPAPAGSHWISQLGKGWHVAAIGAFRSGFPFNVIAAGTGTGDFAACPGGGGASSPTELIRNRPSLLPGRSPFLAQPISVPGGVQVLDPSSFCIPAPGILGNLGRNSLTGPGFWSVDTSLARTFPLRLWGERSSIQLRADFFNAFNHANPSDPDGLTNSPTFGRELPSRSGVQPAFPSLTPVDQIARQIQLQLKISF